MSQKTDHDMIVAIHEVVVEGKMAQRVGRLEQFAAGAKVILGLISAGITALVVWAWTGHLPAGK